MGKVTEYHGTIKPMGNDKNNISAIIEKKNVPLQNITNKAQYLLMRTINCHKQNSNGYNHST